MFPVDKTTQADKKLEHTNVLVPCYPISYLTIASSVFFLGAYGSLPDAAIWWCLRTGGGGVVTSCSAQTERQTNYYESGNSWQWEFLEVCWKFPGKFPDFACFVA
jgi:hypothetical protein